MHLRNGQRWIVNAVKLNAYILICNWTEWYLKPSICKWIVRLCTSTGIPNYHELCISHHPQPVWVCHPAIAIPMQQKFWMFVSVEQEVITQMQSWKWSGEVVWGRTWCKWEMQLCAMANVLVDMNNIIFPIYCMIYDKGHAMIGWWLNCTGFCYGFVMEYVSHASGCIAAEPPSPSLQHNNVEGNWHIPSVILAVSLIADKLCEISWFIAAFVISPSHTLQRSVFSISIDWPSLILLQFPSINFHISSKNIKLNLNS